MDFGQAALLIAAVFAVTEFVLRLVPNLDSRLKQLVSFVLAVGVVFLVRETVWAHEQIIGGQALDTLNTESAVLVGLLIGTGANVLHSIIGKGGAIQNIGDNQS